MPGSDERKLGRAFETDADGVVADLEDAVATGEKPAARELVRRFFATPPTAGGPLRLVRVNAIGSPFVGDDLALVCELDLAAIVLPKATPEAVAALGPDGPPVVAIVETAEGVRTAYEIASQPRVACLQIGAVDLAAEVGLEPRPDGLELLYVRSKTALDSVAAGIRTPFDVVHVEVHDQDSLADACRLARSLGFRGKACIHPGQVPVVNAAFAPSGAEVTWARRVVEAYDAAVAEGRGAVALDGEMIDLPVVARAQRLLTEAERR